MREEGEFVGCVDGTDYYTDADGRCNIPTIGGFDTADFWAFAGSVLVFFVLVLLFVAFMLALPITYGGG